MSDPAPIDVLIVDDSRCDAQLIHLWLRNSSLIHAVEAVHNGHDAVDRIRSQGAYAGLPLPKLILLDLHLPDMSGWELLEEVNADLKAAGIPVVILTGTVQRTDSAKAATRGCVDCLAKPFDADEFEVFVQRIESVIRDRN